MLRGGHIINIINADGLARWLLRLNYIYLLGIVAIAADIFLFVNFGLSKAPEREAFRILTQATLFFGLPALAIALSGEWIARKSTPARTMLSLFWAGIVFVLAVWLSSSGGTRPKTVGWIGIVVASGSLVACGIRASRQSLDQSESG